MQTQYLGVAVPWQKAREAAPIVATDRRAAPRGRKNSTLRSEDGFSLVELLVVLVIVGVLVLLALPRFSGVATRAKMTEARLQLRLLDSLQRSHHLEFDRYASSLAELGFTQEKTVSEGGTARYLIAIESAGTSGYVGIATSIVDFDGDGVLNVWEVSEATPVRQRVAD